MVIGLPAICMTKIFGYGLVPYPIFQKFYFKNQMSIDSYVLYDIMSVVKESLERQRSLSYYFF